MTVKPDPPPPEPSGGVNVDFARVLIPWMLAHCNDRDPDHRRLAQAAKTWLHVLGLWRQP